MVVVLVFLDIDCVHLPGSILERILCHALCAFHINRVTVNVYHGGEVAIARRVVRRRRLNPCVRAAGSIGVRVLWRIGRSLELICLL